MFNLSRHFSILSFVLIALAGGVLAHFEQAQAVAHLLRLAEERNVAMAQVFRNTLWPPFADFVRQAGGLDPAGLRAAPEVARLQGQVAAQMRETEVIKVKIYNLAGRTVFSSDAAQLGEDRRGNAGVRAALGGQVRSELTHRNSFDTFEGSLLDVDVIASYVPIRDGRGATVGVFEVYQNVTPFLAYLHQTQWWSAAAVLGVFALLYLAQFLIVRRAHRILRQQEEALGAANRDLDSRVKARTEELEAANRRLQEEVGERRGAEARLDHLAYHDPLTGLPNRLLFNDRLDRSLMRAARKEQQLAVLFIDLDRFKNVNDTLGHPVGDQLLKLVAGRLSAGLRGGDTLARLGGDEFICLIEDVKDPADAGTVARKFIEQLAEPFRLGGSEFDVSASIGVSLYPSDGATVDTLVRNADTAMYQAKANGRGICQFYAPAMTTYAMARLRIEGHLRHAIDRGELSLHFQPQVDSASGRLLGAEALVRWTHPELGPVLPVQFIPIAEETGFIVPLGEWVLREACRQVAAWDTRGFRLPKVSVNVSVKQIDRVDMVGLVTRVLTDTGLAPERLELEITESVIMAVDDAFAVLDRLRGLGIQLAVDDFGTGYSSLSYLKRLPIGKLKIDRAFIVGIGENPGDEAIIRAIVALARSLSLDLIAEGVETQAQCDFLAGEGCPGIQGYLLGRPTDAATLEGAWAACETAGQA